MKEKWIQKQKSSDLDDDGDDGQPIAKKWNIVNDSPIFFHKQSKLLTQSPSLNRAIENYNNLSIDNNYQDTYGYNNTILPGFNYNDHSSCHSTSSSRNNSRISYYDHFYPTISSISQTYQSYSNNGSINQLQSINNIMIQNNDEYDDQNNNNNNENDDEVHSTNQLIMNKMKHNIKSFCIHLSTIIYTISLACGFGTFYRLTQMTLLFNDNGSNGSIPFLIAYIILMLLIGLPLIFFELGIGQMSQEGFIKTWRAVPFFRGIGYIKLITNCFLCIYYPLYIILAIMYFLWILKGTVPFNDCSNGVIMTSNGYFATTKTGQECLRNTFLQSPFTDPYYFGIIIALLIFIWTFIGIMSLKRTSSFTTSLLLLFFPLLICYIILISKSVLMETYNLPVLYQYFNNINWSLLTKFDIWYYATIQIFFSTNIGLGTFVTNGGIIYNQVNPLSTAIGYITSNLIFGIGFIIIINIFILPTSTAITLVLNPRQITDVQLFTTIYDAIVYKSDNIVHFQYWTIPIYFIIIFSGLISMATFTYSLLKAITRHNELNIKWWKLNTIFCIIGFILSVIFLLKDNFDLVHLLDHYIVGNLIILCIVFEMAAFLIFYGTKRIQSDFEFILGRNLSKIWLLLWWLIPLYLICIFICNTTILNGTFNNNDPIWLYSIGWSTILLAVIIIIAIGLFVVRKQDGYTIIDKLKSTFEPSHNWGPKDPMLRHNWVQWIAKSQTGEKDFSLKRQGTKDYTKTIKRQAKKRALNELDVTASVPGAYVQMINDHHHGKQLNSDNK